MILRTQLEQGLEPDLMDDTNPDDIYCGYVVTDTDHCLIRRYTKETIDGKEVTRVRYPYGRYEWFYPWTDRLTFTDWRYRDFPPDAVPPVVLGLNLTWDNIINVPVADATSVSDWNTFLDLPANGTAFTSVTVTGNTVKLIGGSGITFKDYLFGDSINGPNLIQVDDTADCVTACGISVFSIYGIEGYGCPNITKCHLAACTSLSDEVFGMCNLLNDLALPFDSYTSLGNRIFMECASLTDFNYPNLIDAGVNCFRACVSVTTQSFPVLTTAGFGCFNGNTGLTSLDFPLLTTAGDECFQSCTGVINTYFPALTTAGNQSFLGCISATNLDFPVLTTAGSGCFSSWYAATTINLPLLETAGGVCFDALNLTSIELPALTTAGDQCFVACTSLTSINLPLLNTSGNQFFSGCTSLTTIDLPSLTALGTTVANNSVFLNIIGNVITLTIPAALMTCNAGNPDGDIQYLQANDTVTIITV